MSVSLPIVVALKQTIESDPCEWVGRLQDGRYLYIKYANDMLDVRVGTTTDDAVIGEASTVHRLGLDSPFRAATGDGETLLTHYVGERPDNSISLDEVQQMTSELLVFAVEPDGDLGDWNEELIDADIQPMPADWRQGGPQAD